MLLARQNVFTVNIVFNQAGTAVFFHNLTTDWGQEMISYFKAEQP